MTEVVSLHQTTARSKPAVCQTPTLKGIFDTLKAAQQFGLLGVILGAPGTGKTTAIETYAKAHRHVHLVRMTKASSEMKAALGRICSALVWHGGGNQSASDLYDTICHQLEDNYSRKLLILDEAQHLEDGALETIRDLFDETGAGVVLVGHADDFAERWRDGAKGKRFAQLRGRIGVDLRLARPTDSDLAALCSHYELDGPEARKLLTETARQPGGLHNVGNLLRVARELAGGGTLTVSYLKDAASITGGR